MKKPTRAELLKELLAQLEADESYNVDDAQDMTDLLTDNIIDVLKGQGFTGQDADADNDEFDNLVEYLKGRVMYVPGHWELTKPRRKR